MATREWILMYNKDMKKIKLTQGKYAIVDNEDFENLNQHKWYFHKAGYALRTCHKPRNVKKQETFKVYMHHEIMGKHINKDIDHIDGNSLNNKKNNLRIVTHLQNTMNRWKPKRETSSQYKGVYYNKRDKGYYARLASKCVGFFKDEKLAAQAYNIKALELFGQFALLNKV